MAKTCGFTLTLFDSFYCIVIQIFGFKDNLSPAQTDEEDSKQVPPKPPRSAFMCFTDAKKKELLERDGLPQKKKELLNLGTCHSSKSALFSCIDLILDCSCLLVAVEWRKLSDRERAFWDEEARNDKVRYVPFLKSQRCFSCIELILDCPCLQLP